MCDPWEFIRVYIEGMLSPGPGRADFCPLRSFLIIKVEPDPFRGHAIFCHEGAPELFWRGDFAANMSSTPSIYSDRN